MEQRPDEHGGQDHDDDRGNRRQRNAAADGAGQLLPLLCPEILGDHDAGSHGDADKQDKQKVQNRSRAAHGGQGIIAHIAAHHNAVNGVIKLLGNVADEHGDGKGDNLFPGRSHRHIRGREKAL